MAIKFDEAIAAINGTRGNVTKIADKLGCTRENVYRLRHKWAKFDKAIVDEKDKFKDLIETTIEDEAINGNTTMLIFYAKTQMKDRGYVERQEVSGVEGGPVIVVNWDAADNKD